MKRLQTMMSALLLTTVAMAADVKTLNNSVTIRPDGGQAKVIRLAVMNDRIIRVQATCENAFPTKNSLMIVPQSNKSVAFNVTEDGDEISVRATAVIMCFLLPLKMNVRFLHCCI